ncbi:iron complex transport system permease protein [Methanococcoides vulcani]|uniref:Iron complex transport system permease protein n=1 Tax=Methanococcoides vulcani TaxID=1353158 RepID=A0A1H9YMK8_9EURY|nr:iron ABC transporter permease [Methanococcoides vulcani]SES70274.1 iron complex transport system permease protein [Methanococcoides vulcani]
MNYDDRGPETKRKIFPLMTLFIVLLSTFFVLDLVLGSVKIPVDAVISILLGQDVQKESWEGIILNFRLPRACAAVFGGSALAVAGLQMQTLFRNPLAGPYILGISSGASLGVALIVLSAGASTASALVSGMGLMGDAGVAMAAFIGSSTVMLIVLFVSRRVENSMTILILGLMFGYVTSSVVTVLMHFSAAERVQAFIIWTFGSFAGVTWQQVYIMTLFSITGLVTSFLLAKPLNALLLGERYATSMGMNFSRTRSLIIISTALLAGTVTAFCGPIAFLGVAVPHLCRGIFVTADHRTLVPACALVGAFLALASDLLAQMPGSDLMLPLNSITSLLGAPVVIWVVIRGSKSGRGVSI